MKELSAADEKKQAAQAVQRLKQKQIALIMQSVADVQATVEEVSPSITMLFPCGCFVMLSYFDPQRPSFDERVALAKGSIHHRYRWAITLQRFTENYVPIAVSG